LRLKIGESWQEHGLVFVQKQIKEKVMHTEATKKLFLLCCQLSYQGSIPSHKNHTVPIEKP